MSDSSNKIQFDFIRDKYKISHDVIKFVESISDSLNDTFIGYCEIEEYNQLKVLNAMQESRLTATDFYSTTGYGYGDAGRDRVEMIFTKLFEAEDSIVRPIITSGTHALSLALSGILLPGDQILSITGKPYDTLQKVIGISGDVEGNLLEFGITYDEVDLANNKIQIKKSIEKISSNTKLILIQRSTGYGLRSALHVEEIGNAIKEIKSINSDLPILVDNCYGEFTDTIEPTQVGADICVGSLIKNPGGGIALCGGYIVGKKKYINRISNRLTAPGLGKDVGLSFNTTRSTLQGLFLAPKITIEALKGAKLMGEIFSNLGYTIYPDNKEKRSDIIQAIEFNNPDKVIQFCIGIQEAAAVDAFVTPYPWDMPGYSDKVIMASGSFIDGSSIEISADGPLREPFVAYYQGGLSYYQCKLAAMIILQKFIDNDLLDINNIR